MDFPLFAVLLSIIPVKATLSYWESPERSRRVQAIAPGERVEFITAATLLKTETQRLLAQWERQHGAYEAAKAYAVHEARITGSHLLAQPPIGPISPYARLLSGSSAAKARRNRAMIGWCPVRDVSLGLPSWNSRRPLEARLSHGITVYSRLEDYPKDHPYAPDRTVMLTDLNGKEWATPARTVTSPDGSQWEIYPTVVADSVRWRELKDEVVRLMWQVQKDGDPYAAHQLARALDVSADVYYRLPLAYQNDVALMPDGSPLTRAVWETLERGKIFTEASTGHWNRATPVMNRGWVTIRSSTGLKRNDLTWVEPFAVVRHHPAFREYSRQRYGSPDALDEKVRRQLMGEIAHLLASSSGHIWQSLIQNYQNAAYTDLYLLGVLCNDRLILDFGRPANEVTLYNHHHYDGMTAEGSPNYMGMLGHYYRHLRSPAGWLLYEPRFLEKNPFFAKAAAAGQQLTSARGMSLEIGDQHVYAWPWSRRGASRLEEKADEQRPGGNWPGFGVGILRAGGPGQRLEATLTYTRQTAHVKSDILGIDLWSDGFPLIRRGGYASKGSILRSGASGAEQAALQTGGWPASVELLSENPYFYRGYASSPLAQNAPVIDRLAPDNNRKGLPRLTAYWPGAAGEGLRPVVQAIEATDDSSLERLGSKPGLMTRALMMVEGSSGRAVLIDMVTLEGGREHQLYTGVWGEAVTLPLASDHTDNLAVTMGMDATEMPTSEWWNGGRLPGVFPGLLRQVTTHRPGSGGWRGLWHSRYGAWRSGVEEEAPPEAILSKGAHHLELWSFPEPGALVHTAKGPWVAGVQITPNGRNAPLCGNVAFTDAIAYFVETREQVSGPTRFVRVMEARPEGSPSALKSVERLPANAPAIALRLHWVSGESDTVIYNPEETPLTLSGQRMESDARFAFLRERGWGWFRQPQKAAIYRGSTLKVGRSELLAGAALWRGELIDLKADLTGFRDETLLFIRPATGGIAPAALEGRWLELRMGGSPLKSEWHRVEKAEMRDDGVVALRLEGAPPLARGWHQATRINPGGEVQSWRPFWTGMNSLLNHNTKAYFPRIDRVIPIRRTADSHGDTGRISALFALDDLRNEGVQEHDWFLIHDVAPGAEVVVPLEMTWRKGEQ